MVHFLVRVSKNTIQYKGYRFQNFHQYFIVVSQTYQNIGRYFTMVEHSYQYIFCPFNVRSRPFIWFDTISLWLPIFRYCSSPFRTYSTFFYEKWVRNKKCIFTMFYNNRALRQKQQEIFRRVTSSYTTGGLSDLLFNM